MSLRTLITTFLSKYQVSFFTFPQEMIFLTDFHSGTADLKAWRPARHSVYFSRESSPLFYESSRTFNLFRKWFSKRESNAAPTNSHDLPAYLHRFENIVEIKHFLIESEWGELNSHDKSPKLGCYRYITPRFNYVVLAVPIKRFSLWIAQTLLIYQLIAAVFTPLTFHVQEPLLSSATFNACLTTY